MANRQSTPGEVFSELLEDGEPQALAWVTTRPMAARWWRLNSSACLARPSRAVPPFTPLFCILR